MKQEIIKFYQDKDIPISLLISKTKGLQAEQVEAGAVEVFNEIQSGLEINNQDIPRYVWKKSHGLDSAKYKKERLLIFNYDRKVRLLTEKYKKNRKELEKIKSLPIVKELDRLRVFSRSLLWVIIVYIFLKAMGIIL